MAVAAKVDEGLEGVEFFGEVDRNRDGVVGSEFPAYYHSKQKQQMDDEIRSAEFKLQSGAIPEKDKPAKIAELKKMKERADAIEKSKPKLTGQMKDAIASVVGGLGEKITESMYSVSEMERGSASGGANADREYDRQVNPCIALKGDEVVIAKKLNCRIVGGKVSRNDAVKIWKICNSVLGEETNAEVLRARR